MGVASSRQTRKSHFTWRFPRVSVDGLGHTYTKHFPHSARPISETRISKSVYDFLDKTSFLYKKLQDAFSAKYNLPFEYKRRNFGLGGTRGSKIRLFCTEGGQQYPMNHEIQILLFINYYERKEDYRLDIEADFQDFDQVLEIVKNVLAEVKSKYEAHLEERNSLVALASSGTGTAALEVFARHYYPSSIRSVAGDRIPIDDTNPRTLARQYSQALRDPQVAEVLFN